MKTIIYLTFLVLPITSWAHRSGCHRWHSCPSDSGSYTCGDLGYPCRYGTSTSTYLKTKPTSDRPFKIDSNENKKVPDAIETFEQDSQVKSVDMSAKNIESDSNLDGNLILKSNPESASTLSSEIKTFDNNDLQDKFNNKTELEKTDDSLIGTNFDANIPEKAIVVPSANPTEIRNLLRDHIPQFRYCYQTELDNCKNPESLKATLNLKFTIESEGKITSSEVTSNPLILNKTVSCVKNVLDGIKFPVTRSDSSIEITQKINFYPKIVNK